MNLAGIRIGALITRNDNLLRVVKNTSMYTAVPAVVQKAAAKLLNDKGKQYHVCSHVRYMQTFVERKTKNTGYLNLKCILLYILVTVIHLGECGSCLILICCLFYFELHGIVLCLR
jgi:histidinol-phosphate/aromatic aminotransferase/cobyric acid decarboxylase-like protein